MAKKKADKPPLSQEPWVRRLIRNKYNAIRTIYKGRTYASRMEASRAAKLDEMKESGEVLFWAAQPGAIILDVNRYYPDYLVFAVNGKYWYEEIKGMMTISFKTNARLWKKYGPCDLHVITKSGTHIITPDRLEVNDQSEPQEESE